MLSELDNKVLLTRISENSDKAAFGELFKRFHAKLVAFASTYVKYNQEAEDVVSEVFIRLLRQQEKLGNIDNFEGYLYFAVKNECLNNLKRNKKKNQLFTNLDFDDLKTGEYTQPLNQLLTTELRMTIAELVNKLPQKRKLVYKMIKDDGLKITEVAKLLDIAEKTVKKHLELAVRELKVEITTYLASNESDPKVIPINKQAGYLSLSFLLAQEGLDFLRYLD